MDIFKVNLEIYPLPKADCVKALTKYLEMEGISAYDISGLLPNLQKNRDSIIFPQSLAQGNSEALYLQMHNYLKTIFGVINCIQKPFLIDSGGGSFNEYLLCMSNFARAAFCSGIDSLDDPEKKRGIPRFRNTIWAIDNISSNATDKDHAIKEMATGFGYLALYFFKEHQESEVGLSTLVSFLNEASKEFAKAAQFCNIFAKEMNAMSDVCIALACMRLSKNHEELVQDQPNKGHFGLALGYAKKAVALSNRSIGNVIWASLQGKVGNFAQTFQAKLPNLENRNNQIYKDQVPAEGSCYLPELEQKVITALNPFADAVSEFEELLSKLNQAKVGKYLKQVQGFIAQVENSNPGVSIQNSSTIQLHENLTEQKEKCREGLLKLRGLSDALYGRGKNVDTIVQNIEKFQMKFIQADEIDLQTMNEYNLWKATNMGSSAPINPNSKSEFIAFAQNFNHEAIIQRVKAGESQNLSGPTLEEFVLAPITSRLKLMGQTGIVGSLNNPELDKKFNFGLTFYVGLAQKLNEIEQQMKSM